MATATLTPMQVGAPKTLGKSVFRKQLLPNGSITYKGRKVDFDEKYRRDLARAFEEGAFDQVPFLLADKDNAHTMDPERFRGDVLGIECAADGLYVTMDLTPDAAELVRKNPKLGVSARIIEGLEHADGRTFDRAVQHVLGTLDPRVTGMKPWEEVSLAAEVGVEDTFDLSNMEYDKEEQVTTSTTGAPAVTEPPPVEGSTSVELTAEDKAFIDMVVDAARSAGGVSQEALDLVRTQAENAQAEIRQLKSDNAKDRWTAEKRQYLQAGVPRVMLELATPVMELTENGVLELSRGTTKLDAAKVIREILDQARGTVDLNRLDGTDDDEGDSIRDAEEDKLVDAWDIGDK